MRNTQEYINNLINKPRIFYLDLSTPGSFSQCSHCNKKSFTNTNPNLTGEIENLSEFENLRSINASNNQFTTLNGLFTLPNKNSVKSLNFFNNKISEIDLARLFTEFPKLEQLNLDYNPTSAKNLESLTPKQFSRLVVGMKNKKIKFSPYQGTVLADLLEYAQKLISKGENTQSAQQLKKIIQVSSSVQSEKEPSNPSYTPFIVSGILVVSLALLVGYLVDKRGKSESLVDFE
ncbi:hypothetical protein C1645_837841 [Glomus cerebriforme]|uniref:Uncharacterized protein n=1 Tax=Glomus cerebriforme TaxID=658196 RepID=A0A397S852_9GLOM|nr:hypothetical protein C1645_837841 [Glomus cerebriforme]